MRRPLLTGAIVLVLPLTGCGIAGATDPAPTASLPSSSSIAPLPTGPPVTVPALPPVPALTTATALSETSPSSASVVSSAPAPSAPLSASSPVVSSGQSSSAVVPSTPTLDPAAVVPPVPPLAAADRPSSLVQGSLGTAVHLTFDDGPGRDTAAILDILAASGTTATFCVLGSRAQERPDLMQRIVDEGHTLCNHSWSHPSAFETLTAEQLAVEVDRTQQELQRYGPVAWFRAPEGRFGTPLSALRPYLADRGLWLLGWEVDSLDWQRPGVDVVVSNAVGPARPGSIVLLHDAGGSDRAQTVQALPRIITELQAAGHLLGALPPHGR